MLSDFPKVSQLIRGNPPQRLLVIGKWKLFYWDSKRGRASHTCVYIQTHVYTHTYSFYYLFIWLCCVLVVAYTDPSRLRVGSVVVAGGLHYPKVCGILVPPPGIKPTSCPATPHPAIASPAWPVWFRPSSVACGFHSFLSACLKSKPQPHHLFSTEHKRQSLTAWCLI